VARTSSSEAWFAAYLEAYAACGRGDSDDLEELLEYYDVPLLLTADQGVLSLPTREAVVDAVRDQVDGMRAAGYDRSEVLDARTTAVNATTLLHEGHFARVRADGSEIARLRATYVITERATGRRISALLVHGTAR
jgi:hypothetical protein